MTITSSIKIQNALSYFADHFSKELERDLHGFFKRMGWWLTDGVLNGEPSGLFKCKDPYRGKLEKRTVREFLDQEPNHLLGDIQSLRDLFNQQTKYWIEEWFKEELSENFGSEAPSIQDWEKKWSHILEATLDVYALNPEHESEWDKFLDLKLKSVVETWRFKAELEAKKRFDRLSSAAMLNELESCILIRLTGLFDKQRMEYPVGGTLQWLSGMSSELGSYSKIEMGLFVRSDVFRKKWGGQHLEEIDRLYPKDPEWGTHIYI